MNREHSDLGFHKIRRKCMLIIGILYLCTILYAGIIISDSRYFSKLSKPSKIRLKTITKKQTAKLKNGSVHDEKKVSNASEYSQYSKSVPEFVPKFLINKQPESNDPRKNEKAYHKDNQYLQYLHCKNSVRRRMMALPDIQKKYIVDMPILMWDEHFSAAEYDRLKTFHNVYGFLNVSKEELQGTLRQLQSPNNKYMFDNKERKGIPSDGCISCAVVGNGGMLNGSRKGKEIDAHDYVFRVNQALTEGFEEDVGTRISIYCFTLITLSNGLGYELRSIPYVEGIRYLIFADSPWTYSYLNAVLQGKSGPRSRDQHKRHLPRFPVKRDNVKLVHPDFERYIKWSWVNSSEQYSIHHRPTTGAIMLLTALHTCDRVDIYGFGGHYEKYSEHYYDRKFQKHKDYLNHDFNTERELWQYLNKLGIINMYVRD